MDRVQYLPGKMIYHFIGLKHFSTKIYHFTGYHFNLLCFHFLVYPFTGLSFYSKFGFVLLVFYSKFEFIILQVHFCCFGTVRYSTAFIIVWIRTHRYVSCLAKKACFCTILVIHIFYYCSQFRQYIYFECMGLRKYFENNSYLKLSETKNEKSFIITNLSDFVRCHF